MTETNNDPIAAALRTLRSRPPSSGRSSSLGRLEAHFHDLLGARQAGHSWDTIAKELSAAGLPISARTLRTYYAKLTKRRVRRVSRAVAKREDSEPADQHAI